MKMLSKTEVELYKSVTYNKKCVNQYKYLLLQQWDSIENLQNSKNNCNQKFLNTAWARQF